MWKLWYARNLDTVLVRIISWIYLALTAIEINGKDLLFVPLAFLFSAP